MIAREDNFKPYELPTTWDRIKHVAVLPPQKILLSLVASALVLLVWNFQPHLLWFVLGGIVFQYFVEYVILQVLNFRIA